MSNLRSGHYQCLEAQIKSGSNTNYTSMHKTLFPLLHTTMTTLSLLLYEIKHHGIAVITKSHEL